MTKITMESLEASGFEGMIQEGPDAFNRYSGPLPCFVHHRDAGGWCERTGVMQVYGISFCEVHGAEASAGALAELYHDAGNAIEDISGSEDVSANVVADAYLIIGRDEMARRGVEAEEAQAAALVEAYPVIEEHVDPETRDHDYLNPDHGNKDPVDVFFDARMHLYRLMRLSWSVGERWMLEILEEERQAASAQLAFALLDRARKTGQPV